MRGSALGLGIDAWAFVTCAQGLRTFQRARLGFCSAWLRLAGLPTTEQTPLQGEPPEHGGGGKMGRGGN